MNENNIQETDKVSLLKALTKLLPKDAVLYDDEDLRRRCIEVVKREGQENFFKNKRWRQILKKEVFDFRTTSQSKERYETIDERDRAIFQELRESKDIIEYKLPGKTVDQLCFPWYRAEKFAVNASKKAGFILNYFGQILRRPTNRPGDDLFSVVRVEDIFLKRLPGKGRESLRGLFKKFNSRRKMIQTRRKMIQTH